MKIISRPSNIAVTLIAVYILSAANACFNCKGDKHPIKSIKEPFDDRETGKVFYNTFKHDQKLDWAHHQIIGEGKARRRGVEPTDHNYNTMMLAVSKGLNRPYRALYRSRSGNQEIWNQNKGTQHVEQLTQKLNKEKGIIGKIKNLFPHKKSHDYQRIRESSTSSTHPSSSANSEAAKGNSINSKLNEHVKEVQSPRSREKVKTWLAGIPDDLYDSSISTSKPQKKKRTK